jgi:triosephosphate isomerase
MRYLVGNWKSNKTLEESLAWLKEIREASISPEVEVVICPPYPFLATLANDERRTTSLKLGVQDVSPFPFGAYTGAIAAEMIKDWAHYAILGHSERRKYFHETHQEVANKVDRCVEAGIVPIVCVDEDYIDQQMAAIQNEHIKKIIIAYEPLSAIGSGDPDTPEHSVQVAQTIKDKAEFDVPVLYGGSVKPGNIQSFLSHQEISGALVGGASLDADEWNNLITAFALA